MLRELQVDNIVIQHVIGCALLTSIATVYHHMTLLQDHRSHCLCCAFYPGDELIPYWTLSLPFDFNILPIPSPSLSHW